VVPGSAHAIDLGDCQAEGAFACALPDLGMLGGEYCMSLHAPGRLPRAHRCGGALGMRDFSIAPAPPRPRLVAGAQASPASDMLSWTGPGQPVYQLTFDTDDPGAYVIVYLAKPSFSWTDFRALAVPLGADTAVSATVAALIPYAGVDELASGVEPLSVRTSWQRLESQKLELAIPEPVRHVATRQPYRGFSLEDAARLPACALPVQAAPLGAYPPGTVGEKVSLRGVLRASSSYCPRGGLPCANGQSHVWTVEEPDRKGWGLALFHDLEPLHVTPYDAIVPRKLDIEVVASGTLLPRNVFKGVEVDAYPLDNVTLCAVPQATPTPAPARDR
jgi:hypothetical protein